METEEQEELRYHKVTRPENYPDDEQSDRSHVLEHHMKIQQLERKLAFLQSELERAEQRRQEFSKDLMVFCLGMACSLVLVIVFSS